MNKKKRRMMIAAVLLVLAVSYAAWSSSDINALDLSADEVSAVNIGSSHTDGFPEITDKEDIQTFIDGFNGLRHTVKAEFPGMSGAILYEIKFTMEDGEEVWLTMTGTDPKDHRTAPAVTVRYTVDEKPRLLSAGRGSLAFFYELHDKYVPA